MYAWELQRPHAGLWFPVGGEDARGVEKTDLPAMEFAEHLETRLRPGWKMWRICVWENESGVGRLPDATLLGGEER